MSYVSLSNMVSGAADAQGRATTDYVDEQVKNTFNILAANNLIGEGLKVNNGKIESNSQGWEDSPCEPGLVLTFTSNSAPNCGLIPYFYSQNFDGTVLSWAISSSTDERNNCVISYDGRRWIRVYPFIINKKLKELRPIKNFSIEGWINNSYSEPWGRGNSGPFFRYEDLENIYFNFSSFDSCEIMRPPLIIPKNEKYSIEQLSTIGKEYLRASFNSIYSSPFFIWENSKYYNYLINLNNTTVDNNRKTINRYNSANGIMAIYRYGDKEIIGFDYNKTSNEVICSNSEECGYNFFENKIEPNFDNYGYTKLNFSPGTLPIFNERCVNFSNFYRYFINSGSYSYYSSNKYTFNAGFVWKNSQTITNLYRAFYSTVQINKSCYSEWDFFVRVLDTPYCKNMGYTYYQCSALTDYFPNIQYVEDLNSTFAGCTLLYGSIKNIDTPTILSSTFDKCSNLQSVNSMNISNVEDMSNCFSYCYNLRHVKIIANSNKLTNASHAFYLSKSLEVFPFENKLPDSIQNCSYMFYLCNNMPSLSSNLRYQIPNNAINVNGMYAWNLNTYLRLTPVSPNSSTYAPESLNVFIYAKNIIDANSCFKSWINTGNYITNNNNNVGMLNIYVIENSVTNNTAFSYSKSFFSLPTGDCWYENWHMNNDVREWRDANGTITIRWRTEEEMKMLDKANFPNGF